MAWQTLEPRTYCLRTLLSKQYSCHLFLNKKSWQFWSDKKREKRPCYLNNFSCILHTLRKTINLQFHFQAWTNQSSLIVPERYKIALHVWSHQKWSRVLCTCQQSWEFIREHPFEIWIFSVTSWQVKDIVSPLKSTGFLSSSSR